MHKAIKHMTFTVILFPFKDEAVKVKVMLMMPPNVQIATHEDED